MYLCVQQITFTFDSFNFLHYGTKARDQLNRFLRYLKFKSWILKVQNLFGTNI